MSQPLISLCMIVRDAEATIARCLDSIRGAGIDEIVIVDTGSTDRTRAIVRETLLEHGPDYPPNEMQTRNDRVSHVWYARVNGQPRLVTAHFEWVDDFAAARNVAFKLATGVWRGYLDADDIAPFWSGDGKGHYTLRRQIEDIAGRRPEVNCISLPYDYEAGDMLQEKIRFVRWADGWKWEQPIHEFLQRDRPAPRVHAVVPLPVIHKRPAGAETKALERNRRICEKELARAGAVGDERQAGLMRYYLGVYDCAETDFTSGLQLLDSSAKGLGETNLGIDSRLQGARFSIAADNLERALEFASNAVGLQPANREAWAMLGLVRSERQEWERAVEAFDRKATLPLPAFRSAYESSIYDGLVPVAEARCRLRLGDIPGALRALTSVPDSLRTTPRVRGPFLSVHQEIMKAEGKRRLREYVELLTWNCQAPDALFLLEHGPLPASIADAPEIGQLRRFIKGKLPHLESFEAYCETYASIPLEKFHTDPFWVDNVKKLGRAVAVREWAEARNAPTMEEIAADLPSIRVLSIGFQDGHIEGWMMDANPRIQLTVCDVSPHASQGLAMLMERFPGRVHHHQIQAHHYDWAVEAKFDAIFMFEVLEHVPDDQEAIFFLHHFLAKDGVLFISTPVADHWVEPYLTDSEKAPPWYGHVRMYNPEQLHDLFLFEGFDGDLAATDSGGVFLAQMRKIPRRLRSEIAIYVASTPTPFDAESVDHMHVGGSEEAVIYLAPELSKLGYLVTVYTPRPTRSDGKIIHVKDGVRWRDVSDFDWETDRYAAVLFWRAPALLLREDVKKAKYKKLLWLHDTHYSAPTAAYAAADRIIVLSQFHAEAIRCGDGFQGPFTFATNGIPLSDYPELDGTAAIRDPNMVIYGSSPDRGLDNLLAAWPLVRAAVPDATLHVYYTWDLLTMAMDRVPELHTKYGGLRALAESMKDQGVVVHGGVDHKTLAKAYRKASVWAYPTEFDEISCITAMKAGAAGCTPVVCRAGALEETLMPDEPIDSWGGLGTFALSKTAPEEVFAGALIRHLRHPESAASRKVRSDRARARFGWPTVAKRFAEIIKEAVEVKAPTAPDTAALCDERNGELRDDVEVGGAGDALGGAAKVQDGLGRVQGVDDRSRQNDAGRSGDHGAESSADLGRADA